MAIWTKLPATEALVPRLYTGLRLYLTDQAAFAKRVEAGFKFLGQTQNLEQRLTLLKNGWISQAVFIAMVCGGESFSSGPLQFMWQRLIDEDVFVDMMSGVAPGAYVSHQIASERLVQLLAAEALPNIFRSPSALAETYSASILAVDVVKSGQEFRGSGFILNARGQHFVVTCKHNVDPGDDIESVKISDTQGRSIEIGGFTLHPSLDVAWSPLPSRHTGPTFCPGPASEMFDEVFTLGYPMIPGGLATLVGHRGEVNGYVDLYLAKTGAILVSNLVSPGNSGCPVIRKDGLCVGMTIRWAEGEYGADKARFSCALPIADIVADIS